MNVLLRLALVLAVGLSMPAVFAQGKTKVRLLLSADAAKPGDTVTAAVEMTMPPAWHTYWRNPGDSGIPTTIAWELPAGITAGEIQWPLPEKYVAEGLTTYVFHDTVLLLVPLKLAPGVASGTVELKAHVSWLECEVACLPGDADVDAKLAIANESRASEHAARIAEAQAKVPSAPAPFAIQAQWSGAAADETRALLIEASVPQRPATADFFPFENAGFKVLASELLDSTAGKVRLAAKVEKGEGTWPTSIAGLFVTRSTREAPPQAYPVTIAIGGAEAGLGSRSGGAAVGSTEPRSLAAMLLFAFIGGLILNIMPCVLPVIALKILGFVNESRNEPGHVRKLGVVYGLGVLFSFLVLAGLIIGVQKAGGAAGWGMQFQNPYFLIAMTVLVTLVALNLFGLFEITLGGSAMSAAGELASKSGPAGAFFNGVLATALATPCTAPFLGIALGFAFAQPPLIIVVMFLTIGLGLAFPYVVLSWFPQWLKFLPKPGAWMERFKIAMGFPMVAVAIWLLALAADHFGEGGVVWLGIFLVTIATATWIWGEFVQRGSRRRGLAMAIAVLLVVSGYVYALEKELNWRAPEVRLAASGSGKTVRSGGLEWQPWTPAAIEQARASGRPVLVDFTANWCLTCKLNKKTSIEIDGVREKLRQVNAVTLKGDFTRKDPAIAAELQKFGRGGVPLVLVYPADASKAPLVLPELLTPGIVLDALNRAGGPMVAAGDRNTGAN